MTIYRDTLADGSIQLKGERCAFVYTRPRPGVLRITISGHDTGELGLAPLEEVIGEILRQERIALFVDTRQAFGPTALVRRDWTELFRQHQASLARVVILATSAPLQEAASLARRLSNTGELVEIYAEPERFDAALTEATRAAQP
jgi:hypothetical protein